MTRGIAWPIGIVTVLAVTIAANLYVMYLADHDPSFAIEPNYYAKAVAWDSTLAAAARSRALGWGITPVLSPFSERSGAHLSIALVDSAGAPVRGATVHVNALFIGDANRVVTATCVETNTPPRYATMLPVGHAGVWELHVTAVRGAEHFVKTVRVDAVGVPTP